MAEIYKQLPCCRDPIHLPQRPVDADSTAALIAELPSIAQMTLSDEELKLLQDQAYQEAYEKGFNQGLAEGREKGEEIGRDRASQQAAHWDALIENVAEAVAQQRLSLRTDIADIVLAISQQFFIHQQHHSDQIGLQINGILRQLNQDQIIEIALHPQDLALIQQGRIKLELKTAKNIRIIADDNCRLGGCLIKTEHGFFDASIEKQIDRLKDLLLQIKQGGSHASMV